MYCCKFLAGGSGCVADWLTYKKQYKEENTYELVR